MAIPCPLYEIFTLCTTHTTHTDCVLCRPCVKDHNSIVLRAENVGIKYEWITRMMRTMAASAGPPPAAAVQPQQPQPQAAPPAAADQQPSRGKRSSHSLHALQSCGANKHRPLVLMLSPSKQPYLWVQRLSVGTQKAPAVVGTTLYV